MNHVLQKRLHKVTLRVMLCVSIWLTCGPLALAAPDKAESLRALYGQMQRQLADSPLQRLLQFNSAAKQERVSGDAFARVEFPFWLPPGKYQD